MKSFCALVVLSLLVISVQSSFGGLARSGSRVSSKRSLAPRVQFQNYPYIALVMATNQDDIVEYVCTGSIVNKDGFAHVLTTAYCIQDRDDSQGRPVTYTVLVEDPTGEVNLGLFNFTQFDVRQRFFHPNATDTANFNFVSQWPNGTEIGFSVALSPFDLGILRLNSSIDIEGAGEATLGDSLPSVGSAVSFVGYGGPQFFTLGASSGTRVINSKEVVGNNEVANTKIIFLHDVRDDIDQNQTQAVEPGDEGAPIVDSNNRLVGVVQGSWQVNTDETGLITFATLGTAIADNIEWIDSIVKDSPPVTVSTAAFTLPNLALGILVASIINYL